MLSIALLLALPSAQPRTAISAGQAMAAYQGLIRFAINHDEGNCSDGVNTEIVVCGRHQRQPPRLPLPEERDGGGDRQFHLGEPAGSVGALAADSFHCGPTSCDPPSRQAETARKLVGALKGLVTGSDPVP